MALIALAVAPRAMDSSGRGEMRTLGEETDDATRPRGQWRRAAVAKTTGDRGDRGGGVERDVQWTEKEGTGWGIFLVPWGRKCAREVYFI